MSLRSKTVNYRDIHYECDVAGMIDDKSALLWLDTKLLRGSCVVDGVHIVNWSSSTAKPSVSKDSDISQISAAISCDRDYVSGIIVKCKYKSRPIKVELDLESYMVNIFVRKNNPVNEEELLKVLGLN